MTRYAAFLRAINVGGRYIKMEELRRLLEAMGLAQVTTFIQSGNVLFESAARKPALLEARIEAHLRQALGYEVATFVRSLPELNAIAGCNPFAEAQQAADSMVYIAFLREAPSPERREAVLALRNPVDDFYFQGRELYWLSRKNQQGSAVSGNVLEKRLGMPATVRNATTLRKMAAMLADN